MKKIVILIIVLIVVAGAIYFLDSRKSVGLEEGMAEDKEMEQYTNDAMGMEEGSIYLNEANNVLVYSTKDELDLAAQQSGAQLVVLYFYADWCPLCIEEFPKLIEAMNELRDLPIIAFRANFNDSKTSQADQDLAREHGVAYQHTKVFLMNGERVLKSPESWDKDRYIEEINKILK